MNGPSEDLVSPAMHRLCTDDSLAAIAFLNDAEDPVAVMKAYRDLLNRLYWKEKDLASAVVMARAGIQYGMTFAAGRSSGEILADLRSLAKTLAYNLASFTWPGWDEPGVATGPTVAGIGLDAAKLNLRLAEELNKGDLPLCRGHWMLGAQLMANGEPERARNHFEESARFAERAESTPEVWLAFGFAALTRLMENPEDGAAQGEVRHVLTQLREMKDGPEFAGQIVTAARVFGLEGVE